MPSIWYTLVILREFILNAAKNVRFLGSIIALTLLLRLLYLCCCLVHRTLIDPLQFELEYEPTRMRYSDLCAANATQWEAVKLNEMAQERQEDWMALWVTEMLRIAKPGAPVIVESLSLPLCDVLSDYGGLSKDFWAQAIDKYGWDVNPASIVFGDDVSYEQRYHVALRKNE
jgi:hypothetical protein